MRQWVTPRALLLHVALLAIAGGCFVAAWWQVHRAMQGNALSYFYSVEWPAFAVVAGIGWWQMVRDTPEDIENRRRFRAQMRMASAEVVARTLPRSALAIPVASREDDRRQLAANGARAELGAGTPGDDSAVLAVSAPGKMERLAAAARLLSDETDVPADEMTEYNRFLALLAIKGKAKTWRNPRGL